MELQQSPLYIQYIKTLGWQVLTIDHTNIFIRNIPFSGVVAKIQRPSTLPSIDKLVLLFKEHHVRTIIAEASKKQNPQKFSLWCQALKKHFKISSTPYIPTKTILIDLTPSETEIFNRFTEAKRRAVRRAQKNNLIIKESNSIDDLIKIKNTSAGFLGFLTTFGIKKLWPIFGPKNGAILLAYRSPVIVSEAWRSLLSKKIASPLARNDTDIVGGVLLLFWENIAYYWIAGATREGKKLFAPTLLVWEALKLSKIRGAQTFDFVGVWDERLPKQYDAWKGFTKFKEGFGGKTIYYPIATLHR